MTTASKNWQTWCDACDEYVAVDHAGSCAWCGGKVRTRARRRPPHKSPPRNMTPELIEAAAKAYAAGHSIRSIAHATFERTTYASVDSYMGSLRAAFRRRDIPIRSAGVARSIHLRRRTMARREGIDVGRRCSAIAGSGEQCLRDALPDRDVCVMHDAEGLERARQRRIEAEDRMRAASTMYSAIADDVAAWADAHGRYGWKVTAQRLVGVSPSTISSLERDRARGVDRRLTAPTEKKLRRLLAIDPHQFRTPTTARGDARPPLPGEEHAHAHPHRDRVA